jgi:hypothetical protein
MQALKKVETMFPKDLGGFVISHPKNGFVKSSRCRGAKTEEGSARRRCAATTKLKRNAGDGLFTKP